MLRNVLEHLRPGLILWHDLQLAQDRVQWWAFVSMVMNLQDP